MTSTPGDLSATQSGPTQSGPTQSSPTQSSPAHPVDYVTTTEGITPDMITGFFVGWPGPPTPEQLIAVMAGSYRRVWAVRDGRVVGYINAISDGVLNAFIPWLEVHPDHQGQGVGAELVRRIVAELDGMYAIDLCCDTELFPYYEKHGFTTFGGAGLRFPAAIRRTRSSR